MRLARRSIYVLMGALTAPDLKAVESLVRKNPKSRAQRRRKSHPSWWVEDTDGDLPEEGDPEDPGRKWEQSEEDQLEPEVEGAVEGEAKKAANKKWKEAAEALDIQECKAMETPVLRR